MYYKNKAYNFCPLHELLPAMLPTHTLESAQTCITLPSYEYIQQHSLLHGSKHFPPVLILEAFVPKCLLMLLELTLKSA